MLSVLLHEACMSAYTRTCCGLYSIVECSKSFLLYLKHDIDAVDFFGRLQLVRRVLIPSYDEKSLFSFLPS